MGGDHYLEAVSVGRDPDDETVRDCAGCSGHVYADRWHLVATVVRARAGRERYHYCGDDCLRSWLAVAAD